MKWLISKIDMDMEKDMDGDLDQDREEYADLLSEMAPSTSPYGSIGRRSFNNNNSHTDRYAHAQKKTLPLILKNHPFLIHVLFLHGSS